MKHVALSHWFMEVYIVKQVFSIKVLEAPLPKLK